MTVTKILLKWTFMCRNTSGVRIGSVEKSPLHRALIETSNQPYLIVITDDRSTRDININRVPARKMFYYMLVFLNTTLQLSRSQ